MPAGFKWRVVTLGKRFAGSGETLTAIMAGSEYRKKINMKKIENRMQISKLSCFFLALMVFDFYSFENLKKKKITNFSRKPYRNLRKFHEQNRVRIQLHMMCKFHQDRSINKKSPPEKGSIP